MFAHIRIFVILDQTVLLLLYKLSDTVAVD